MGDPIYWTDAGAVMLESALSVDFLMNNGYYNINNGYLCLIEKTCQLNSGLILFSCEKNRLKKQVKGGQSNATNSGSLLS